MHSSHSVYEFVGRCLFTQVSPGSRTQDAKRILVSSAGDMATKDEDGYLWIQGRSDEVLKIAGHRIGTAEIESALVSHKWVAEAAAIGVPDKIRGEVAKVFVTLKEGVEESEDVLINALKSQVRNQVGPLVIIKEFSFRDKLPKTRSGKIMRRVLRAEELGTPMHDLSTLDD